MENCFDTVLCLNVLEYLDSPGDALLALGSTLKPKGVLITLVPQGPSLFGSLDRAMGHKRRFTQPEMRALLESRGFAVERVANFNRAGAPPWFAYSRLFGSRKISKFILKLFDKTVWIWRRLDWLMPWRGLSLIMVARKGGPAAAAPEAVQVANDQRVS
jgi:SAM-dependent methyltransferase